MLSKKRGGGGGGGECPLGIYEKTNERENFFKEKKAVYFINAVFSFTLFLLLFRSH